MLHNNWSHHQLTTGWWSQRRRRDLGLKQTTALARRYKSTLFILQFPILRWNLVRGNMAENPILLKLCQRMNRFWKMRLTSSSRRMGLTASSQRMRLMSFSLRWTTALARIPNQTLHLGLKQTTALTSRSKSILLFLQIPNLRWNLVGGNMAENLILLKLCQRMNGFWKMRLTPSSRRMRLTSSSQRIRLTSFILRWATALARVPNPTLQLGLKHIKQETALTSHSKSILQLPNLCWNLVGRNLAENSTLLKLCQRKNGFWKMMLKSSSRKMRLKQPPA